ncbi:hypothetical protein ES703_22267 [subsurface metagenome]
MNKPLQCAIARDLEKRQVMVTASITIALYIMDDCCFMHECQPQAPLQNRHALSSSIASCTDSVRC